MLTAVMLQEVGLEVSLLTGVKQSVLFPAIPLFL